MDRKLQNCKSGRLGPFRFAHLISRPELKFLVSLELTSIFHAGNSESSLCCFNFKTGKSEYGNQPWSLIKIFLCCMKELKKGLTHPMNIFHCAHMGKLEVVWGTHLVLLVAATQEHEEKVQKQRIRDEGEVCNTVHQF